MLIIQNRRTFLVGLSAAGAVGLVKVPLSHAAVEPRPETTTVRLPQWKNGSYCWAGAYIAGELLRAEGFTDVRYVQGDPKVDQSQWIANGETDFSINYPPIHLTSIEAGVPIKVLAGLHSGCIEIFANDKIRSVADLNLLSGIGNSNDALPSN
jgi:NitT/TauT family transport system substrate-binding protein